MDVRRATDFMAAQLSARQSDAGDQGTERSGIPRFTSCGPCRGGARRPQHLNYKKIESITWLQHRPLQLEIIPPGLQKRLVAFVLRPGFPMRSGGASSIGW